MNTIQETSQELTISYGEHNVQSVDSSLIGNTKEYIQTALRQYLIASAKSIELSKLLLGLNIYGKTEFDRSAEDRKSKKKIVVVETVEDPLVFQSKSTMLRDSILTIRNQTFSSVLDPKQYPKLSQPSPPVVVKTPVTTLHTPHPFDMADALSYIYFLEQERIAYERSLIAIQELANKQKAGIYALEQQQKAADIAQKIVMANERKALEEARKERIMLVRLSKKNPPPLSSVVKTIPTIKCKHIHGKAHYSKCHHSRNLDPMFKAYDMEMKDGYINSSLIVQIKSRGKSMPLEQIRLEPFGEPGAERSYQRPHTAAVSRFLIAPKAVRPFTSSSVRQRPVTAFEIRSQIPHTTKNELAFIRGVTNVVASVKTKFDTSEYLSDLGPNSSFIPARRYFMPS